MRWKVRIAGGYSPMNVPYGSWPRAVLRADLPQNIPSGFSTDPPAPHYNSPAGRMPAWLKARCGGVTQMAAGIRLLVATVILLVAGGLAAGQGAFPSRPVHLFVPFAPGGAVDIVARTLGDELSTRWGRAVVVENRPGA